MTAQKVAEVFKDAKEEWRFRIKAPNGEIVAEGESYHNEQDAIDTLRNQFGDLAIKRMG